MRNPTRSDHAAEVNAILGGWENRMGLRIENASSELVTGHLEIGPEHLQPYGIVHGGVHSGIIETVCSVGAALRALPRGHTVVGLENSTSFLRAVRSGTLRAQATPIHAGNKSQVWQGLVTDEHGHAVALGRVRLLCIPLDRPLAGELVQVREDGGEV